MFGGEVGGVFILRGDYVFSLVEQKRRILATHISNEPDTDNATALGTSHPSCLAIVP